MPYSVECLRAVRYFGVGRLRRNALVCGNFVRTFPIARHHSEVRRREPEHFLSRFFPTFTRIVTFYGRIYSANDFAVFGDVRLTYFDEFSYIFFKKRSRLDYRAEHGGINAFVRVIHRRIEISVSCRELRISRAGASPYFASDPCAVAVLVRVAHSAAKRRLDTHVKVVFTCAVFG